MNESPVAAPPITVSPRVRVEDLCRLAKTRLKRDGVAQLVAASGDKRQVRQLRRVAGRLASDGDVLCVPLKDNGQGGIYLSVIPRTGYAVAWYPGTPNVG